MKVLEKKNYIKNDFESKEFKIDNNAFMFETLIKGLYSDPAKAVLRELAANAYDAHAEAGNLDKPFDVHIPTYYNNEFYIRDYGPGLSPEKVEDVYTIIGRSDKKGTNDQVGQFGLGSKTPYCVSDNFIVESYYEGQKYVYNMYYNSERKPSYSLLTATKTTEPSGLKIIIKNINNIRYTNYKEVFKYFKLKPNIINGDQVKDPVYTYQQKEYAFGTGSSPVAVMGNIAYPIGNNLDKFDIKYHNFLSQGLVLFFDIGDLSITPSRESLNFDPRTVAMITNKLSYVLDNFIKELQKEIDLCEDVFHATLLSISYDNKFRWLKHTFTYNNVDIDESPIDVKDFDFKSVDGKKYTTFNFKHIHQDLAKYYFYLSDVKNAYSRVKAECSRNYGSKYRYITCNFKDAAEKQKFLDLIGLKDESKFGFVLASTLVNPYTSKTKTPAVTMKKYNDKYFYNHTMSPNDSGYYIVRYKHNLIYNNQEISNNSFMDFLREFKITENIVGVRKFDIDNFVKLYPNMKPINELFDSLHNNKEYEYSTHYTKTINISEENADFLAKKNPTHPILLELAKQSSNIITAYTLTKLQDLNRKLSLDLNFKEICGNTACLDKYPLLMDKFNYEKLDEHAYKYMCRVDDNTL